VGGGVYYFGEALPLRRCRLSGEETVDSIPRIDMKNLSVVLFLLLATGMSFAVSRSARSSHSYLRHSYSHHARTSSRSPRVHYGHHSYSTYHAHRKRAERDAFMRERPCPSTGKRAGPCPGYVVDHVVPLKRGGSDSPSNMQWQTTEAGKAKDRVE